MAIRWVKRREVEVPCELFAREGSGPCVPAEQDDLRRACEAVGLVVESSADRKSALEDAGQAGFARGCSLHAAKLREATERAEKAEAELSAIEARGGVLREAAAAVRGDAERLASANKHIANLEIAELEAPLPEATERELIRVGEEAYDSGINTRREAYLAVAAHVRRERCLIARAVAGGVAVTVAPMPDAPGKWAVVVTSENHNLPGVGDVPWAEVPATLARMIGEVGA